MPALEATSRPQSAAKQHIPEMRILLMAATQGLNFLFCVSNRTNCVLLVSGMHGSTDAMVADY
jgi:hypothetical protein